MKEPIDLYQQQIILELQTKDAGTAKSLAKLQANLSRDEGTTSHGKKVLYTLFNEFQETFDALLEFRANSKSPSIFHKQVYAKCEEYYQELDDKYGDARKFLSHPYNLIPFVIAREVCKQISNQSPNGIKITNIANSLIATLITSYNLPPETPDNVLVSCIGVIKLLIESSKSVEMFHNEHSAVCVRFKPNIIKQAEWAVEHLPVHISFEPMIHPPLPHSDLISGRGGYLTIHSPLLKHPDSSITTSSFDVSEINRIQSTGYRINQDLLTIFDNLGLMDIDIDPLQKTDIRKKQTMVKHLRYMARREEDDVTKQLQQTEALVLENEFNESISDLGQKSGLLRTKMLVEKYKDYDAIYFPLFCDNRGRIYTYCSDLSVQGTKAGKALLQFAETKTITAVGFDALMVAFGGVCGKDKYTLDVRRSHAEELLPLIDMFFEDDCLDILEYIDNDELYYGLGLMLEIYKARTIDDYASGFIVYVDASSSGSQICSLITRSREGAELSNLINPEGEMLVDAYQAVSIGVRKAYEEIVEMSDADLGLMLHYYLDNAWKETLTEE